MPWTNKELDFEYLTFRDKLKPGDEEKWTIKISGKQKDLVMAEVLASMYDASLDDISKHRWMANIHRLNYLRSSVNYFGFGQARPRTYVDRNWNNSYFPSSKKQYRTINWFGLEHIPGFTIYREDVGVAEGAPPRTEERMMSKTMANGKAESDEAAVSGGAMDATAKEEDGDISQNVDVEKEDSIDKNEQQSVRTNLEETVFFYPQLKTDEEGNVLIEFTMNEALTSWNFMAFAHTRDLMMGLTSKKIVTQKELMVRPNAPRFARLGDEVEFSSSISNIIEEALEGSVELKLFDALSLEDVSDKFLEGTSQQSFALKAKDNIAKRWKIRIPEDAPDLLLYRVYAKADQHTDGEEGYLPILSNRTLLTETMPMWIRENETKNYVFSALGKIGDEGVKPHRLTIESTSNPVWYAIQAMPYVTDYQTRNSLRLVNALYANLLSAEIVKQNPLIERVFEMWKQGEDSGSQSLLSNLEKNQELKALILEETPWLLEAKDEAADKQKIALLFNKNQLENDKRQLTKLLKELQNYDGGFSWFNGGRSSEYISLYILNTLGKLQGMDIQVVRDGGLRSMIDKALKYCDQQIAKRYNELIERGNDMEKDHLRSLDIYYLYTRSLFAEQGIDENSREANVYYMKQAENYWLKKGLCLEAMIALALDNRGNSVTAKAIFRSLDERSIYKEELGRYWKYNRGYHWSELALEIQALMVELFDQVGEDEQKVNELQIWLLKHKQTNRWKTPKATVAAIHALLLNNSEMLEQGDKMQMIIGGENLNADKTDKSYEAGSGYFKRAWGAEEIKASHSDIKLINPNDHIAWGAAYFQYFQDIDKVEAYEETPLNIQKEMFKSINGKTGEKLIPLNDGSKIMPGDKLLVRLRIEVDRAMDFVHLRDQRGAALEPLSQISRYHWAEGLFYYLSPGDTGTDFFIQHLPRGVFIIEYPLRAVHSGDFSNGIASLQSIYAPEFSSHSDGSRIVVE